TESIVTMVEEDWLSPEVIGARLARITPSAILLEWLEAPDHVAPLGGPPRDVVRGLARALTQREGGEVGDPALPPPPRAVPLRPALREVPLDASAGRWLADMTTTASINAAFDTVATSLANLASRPRTAEELQWWIERSAQHLRESGRRLMPWVLRRPTVQRR